MCFNLCVNPDDITVKLFVLKKLLKTMYYYVLVCVLLGYVKNAEKLL